VHVGLLTRRFDRSGGGTERDLVITADWLERAGHRVTIFAAEVRGDRDQKNVRVVMMPPIGRALKLWRFAHLGPAMARREGADVVVSFARTIGADVMRSGGGAHASYLEAARKWQGILGASTMRLSPYHRMQMLIERQAFTSPRLRLTITVAEVVRRDLIDRFGLRPDKVVTLYNGVDSARFHPEAAPDERARIRRELQVPDSAPMVIFVGNGFARKGLGFMLEAWPRLKSGAYLIVAGSDRARTSFENRARALKVAGRVRFLGARSDVAELFRAADLLALPSMFEPFGNVVLEAMASGLKVVVSRQSGVAELLPDELKRFAIRDPSEPSEIARCIDEIINAPDEIGGRSRAVAESYSWDRYGEDLLRLLEGVS
jgi:UDP-glucose:(heptosyl)LPS alpha-1,3-glucosyltransferase